MGLAERTADPDDIHLRDLGGGSIGVSLDEAVGPRELETLLAIFSQGLGATTPAAIEQLAPEADVVFVNEKLFRKLLPDSFAPAR